MQSFDQRCSISDLQLVTQYQTIFSKSSTSTPSSNGNIINGTIFGCWDLRLSSRTWKRLDIPAGSSVAAIVAVLAVLPIVAHALGRLRRFVAACRAEALATAARVAVLHARLRARATASARPTVAPPGVHHSPENVSWLF